MNLYPLGKALCSLFFYPLYRIKVIGKENFPKEGGVLLCTNHIYNFDPPSCRNHMSASSTFHGEGRTFQYANLEKLYYQGFMHFQLNEV